MGADDAEQREEAGQRQHRIRYLVSALAGVVLLVLINVSPGWQSWTLLTPNAARVIGLVNITLLVSLGFNIAYLFTDSPLTKGLGKAITSTLTLVVLARLFVRFPFDLPGTGWEVAMRVLLGLAMIASFGALVTGLGLVARTLHVNTSRRTIR